MPQPNLQLGLEYWEQQEPTVDGVLGGYGNGSLPRVDALSSRLFLLSLLPALSTIESPLKPLDETEADKKTNVRALDVGA
jgi:protein N-terminal methyltransferase